MSLSAYNNVVMVSHADDQQSIIGLMNNIYAADPTAEFTFLNIYKELPITSSSKIFELKGNSVEFVTSATQFSIMNETHEVLIQSNLLAKSVIGKVKELDNRRMQVTLGDFSYAEVHSDQRSSVRVRLKLPMQLQMVVDGNNLSGVINDISLGGVLVRTFSGSFLEKAKSIAIKIKLLHNATHEVMEALIPSRLVRIEKKDMEARCAMVFEHTPQSEKVLSTFIYQRQLEIIKELKSKIC